MNFRPVEDFLVAYIAYLRYVPLPLYIKRRKTFSACFKEHSQNGKDFFSKGMKFLYVMI